MQLVCTKTQGMVRLRSCFLLLTGLALTSAASAQVVVWVGDNLDNNYSNAANWYGGVVPPADGTQQLKLVGSGSTNLTLDQNASFYGITFEPPVGDEVNFTITGSGTLSIAGGGLAAYNETDGGTTTLTINPNLILTANQGWNGANDGGGTVIVNGAISGNYSLVLNTYGSEATWVLNSANSTFSQLSLLGDYGFLVLGTSSVGPAGAPTSGPAGTGTLLIGDGNTLTTNVTGPVTIGNNVTLGDESSGQTIVLGGATPTTNPFSNVMTFTGTLTLDPATDGLNSYVAIGNNSYVTFANTFQAVGGGTTLYLSSAENAVNSTAVFQGAFSNISQLNLSGNVSVILDGPDNDSQLVELGNLATGANTYLGIGAAYAASGGTANFLNYLNDFAEDVGSNQAGHFMGTLGFDTTGTGAAATFDDPIDLTAFTNGSFVGLGSATKAILGPDAVITPPFGGSGSAYYFGGGGGTLEVQSPLIDGEGDGTIYRTLYLSGGNAPLTLILSGALSYSNGTSVDGAALIFNTPPPGSGQLSLGQNTGTGYIGSTVASGFSDANTNIQQFVDLFQDSDAAGVVGFDILGGGTRTVTSDINMINAGSGVYLGTATAVNYSGNITPASAGYQFAGVKGGFVTVSSSLGDFDEEPTNVYIGLPTPLESLNPNTGYGSQSSVELSGSNTYTGNTTLQSGYLFVTNSASLGNGGNLLVPNPSNGRTGWIGTLATTGGPVTIGNNIQVDTNGLALNTGESNLLTLTGSISDYGDYGGQLGIYGPVELDGSNSYSGGTLVSGTTVTVGNDNGLGYGILTALSSTINFTTQFPYVTEAKLTNSTLNFTMDGAEPELDGVAMTGTTLNFGTNQDVYMSSFAGDQPNSGNVINLGMGTVLEFNYGVDPTYYGTINGAGGVDVEGYGTEFILAGPNTFTGGLTIGNSMIVTAANNTALGAATSPVTINAYGTLAIRSGVTIANPISIPEDSGTIVGYGTIAPAAPQTISIANNSVLAGGAGTVYATFGSPSQPPVIGTLSFGPNAALDFGDGGSLQFSLMNATGTPGVDYSLIQAAGNLNISASVDNPFTIQLVGVASDGVTLGTANAFDNTQGYNWTLLSAGSITNFTPGAFQINLSEFDNPLGTGGFSVYQAGGDLVLEFSPVPEPSTWLLLSGGLGIVGFGVARRRRCRP